MSEAEDTLKIDNHKQFVTTVVTARTPDGRHFVLMGRADPRYGKEAAEAGYKISQGKAKPENFHFDLGGVKFIGGAVDNDDVVGSQEQAIESAGLRELEEEIGFNAQEAIGNGATYQKIGSRYIGGSGEPFEPNEGCWGETTYYNLDLGVSTEEELKKLLDGLSLKDDTMQAMFVDVRDIYSRSGEQGEKLYSINPDVNLTITNRDFDGIAHFDSWTFPNQEEQNGFTYINDNVRGLGFIDLDSIHPPTVDFAYPTDNSILAELFSQKKINIQSANPPVKKCIFLTKNEQKLQEYKEQLGVYGLKITNNPYIEDEATRKSQIEALLSNSPNTVVIREDSDLYDAQEYDRIFKEKGALDANDLAKIVSNKQQDGQQVYNISSVKLYKLEDGELKEYDYLRKVSGRVDLRLLKTDEDNKWWDRIFVNDLTGENYELEREYAGKVSARQLALSDFVEEHVNFTKHRNLAFNPIIMKGSIDFTRSPLELVGSVEKGEFKIDNPFIVRSFGSSSPWAEFMQNFFTNSMQETYLRTSDNRRSGNYFLPPISGIPLHPKADPFHQTTFQYHDICHQALPDLLFTGKDTPENRMVYVAERMMSEAITLIMADMLFVDGVKESGFQYDYSARAINPLYDAIKAQLLEGKQNFSKDELKNKLHDLLLANVKFALLGDKSYFQNCLNDDEKSSVALENYTKTYQHFFTPDLEWTDGNYKDMVQRSKDFADWKEIVGDDLFKRADLPLLDDVTSSIKNKKHKIDLSNYETAVDAVFEEVFESRILPKLEKGQELTTESVRSKGFLRYMVGQMAFYSKYAEVGDIKERGQEMVARLKDTQEFTPQIIEEIRAAFSKDVKTVFQSKRITQTDAKMFEQIYPLFSPRYLSYDYDYNYTKYNSIPEAVKDILQTPEQKLDIPDLPIVVVASRNEFEVKEVTKLMLNKKVTVWSLNQLEKRIDRAAENPIQIYADDSYSRTQTARTKVDAVAKALHEYNGGQLDKNRISIIGSATDFVLHGTKWKKGDDVTKGETNIQPLIGKPFPGHFAWQFSKSCDNEQIACSKAIELAQTPWAAMETTIALRKATDDLSHPPALLHGNIEGQISHSPQAGDYGSSWDNIFIPQSEIENGKGRTYSQMTPEEKNQTSSRAIALKVLIDRLQEKGAKNIKKPFMLG